MKPNLPIAATALWLALAPIAGASEPAGWTINCASCHGHDGAGHTRSGRMLRVVDLTNPATQKSFTDEQAVRAVKEGLVVRGQTKMKPFKGKLADAEIKALVAYVRTLAK